MAKSTVYLLNKLIVSTDLRDHSILYNIELMSENPKILHLICVFV